MGPGDPRAVCVLAAVPSYPYGITLLNCDGHSMTLGWKVPKFSGGAPILGYYVDKREAQHRNWHEVNASPLQDRILTVGLAHISTPCSEFHEVGTGDRAVCPKSGSQGWAQAPVGPLTGAQLLPALLFCAPLGVVCKPQFPCLPRA